MNIQPIRISREEWYRKIWSQPARILAKEWGISDVWWAKICEYYNIPRPGLGYWKRKLHGYRVKQVPLPKEEDSRLIEIQPQQAKPNVIDDEQIRKGTEKRAFERIPENRITVPEALPIHIP